MTDENQPETAKAEDLAVEEMGQVESIPATKPVGGRDDRGRSQPGGRAGPGRKKLTLSERFARELHAQLVAGDGKALKGVVAKLVAKAQAGDNACISLCLRYGVGTADSLSRSRERFGNAAAGIRVTEVVIELPTPTGTTVERMSVHRAAEIPAPEEASGEDKETEEERQLRLIREHDAGQTDRAEQRKERQYPGQSDIDGLGRLE